MSSVLIEDHPSSNNDTGTARWRLPRGHAGKLALDLGLAAMLLLFLTPLMLVIAALVRLDGGPVFFSHARLGLGGRPFGCLKFRTMVQDSAAVLESVLASDPVAAAEWAATQKLKNDPRTTRVGRVLRSTSLDELPQLINVLRLQMSLVGPRPIVSNEVTRYGRQIRYYFAVRPGLTGLWQVSGRSGTSYAHRIQLDTQYVKNWTMGRDIVIIFKTAPAVLSKRGAV